MFRTWIHTLALLCLIVTPGAVEATAPPPPATEPATDPAGDEVIETSGLRRNRLAAQVDRAIQRGVKYLLARQNADGSWPTEDEQTDADGGRTALCTLSLLSAGESHQSPPMQRAIAWLKKHHPEKTVHATYSVALRACVYAQLPEPVRKRELPLDLNWLQRAMVDGGPFAGMYGYGVDGGGPRGGGGAWGDFSNSQYGVLGVWYAANAGLEVPLSYWKRVERAWQNSQLADGGWPYRPASVSKRGSYASMTAAGAATLYICNDFLHAGESQNLAHPQKNERIEGAMKWLADHYAVDHNPGIDSRIDRQPDENAADPNAVAQLLPRDAKDGTWVFYMLFAYERVGEASGMTRFGDRKWFDEGAYFLVRTQAYDGSWTGNLGSEVDTSYALLFLTRGRAPVAVQKLQFDGRWDNRSRDAAAFVRYMRRASERHMNWQIVSADATPAEFRQSPILYIASDKRLNLSREQKGRIKTYIDQGGLLLCANEGAGDEFAKSVYLLAHEMYPMYEFRNLPQDHPIYTANFPVEGFDDPIRGLSNGARELVVLFDKNDASWKWQSAAGAFSAKLSPYGPLANLLLYVTDKSNPRFKGDDMWVDADPAAKPRDHISIARIKFGGNWDPEPAGWWRLHNILHNENQIDLRFGLADLAQPQAKIDPTLYPLAHFTSTAPVDLPQEQLDLVKRYTDQGGLLLIDVAGGSNAAAVSLEAMLHKTYGDEVKIAPLPLDHAIYRGEAYGGKNIEEVAYRRSADAVKSKLPRLKGVTVENKLVGILSNEDLSAGLVGYATAGPSGYAPQSAVDLVRNIILWSETRAGAGPAAR
jgi:hypothetical protein